jgi:hypothetical protein
VAELGRRLELARRLQWHPEDDALRDQVRLDDRDKAGLSRLESELAAAVFAALKACTSRTRLANETPLSRRDVDEYQRLGAPPPSLSPERAVEVARDTATRKLIDNCLDQAARLIVAGDIAAAERLRRKTFAVAQERLAVHAEHATDADARAVNAVVAIHLNECLRPDGVNRHAGFLASLPPWRGDDHGARL